MRFVLACLLVACNAAPTSTSPEARPAPAPVVVDAAPVSIDAAVSIDAVAVTAPADAVLRVEAVANRCEAYFSKCSCSEVCGTRPQKDCARACEPQEPSHLRCELVAGSCQPVVTKQPITKQPLDSQS